MRLWRWPYSRSARGTKSTRQPPPPNSAVRASLKPFFSPFPNTSCGAVPRMQTEKKGEGVSLLTIRLARDLTNHAAWGFTDTISLPLNRPGRAIILQLRKLGGPESLGRLYQQLPDWDFLSLSIPRQHPQAGPAFLYFLRAGE